MRRAFELTPAKIVALEETCVATFVPWPFRSSILFRVGKNTPSSASSFGTNDVDRERSTIPFMSKLS
jgi:hypothetical protein